MRIASPLYSRPSSPLTRYGIALFAVAIAMAVPHLFGSTQQSTMLLAACAAVILSTSFGGRGPGLFATATLSLFAAYRLPPDHSWGVQPEYQFPLVMFVAIGLFVSLLNLRLSVAQEEDPTSVEAWHKKVRAPAEATADLTALTPEARLQAPDEHVLVSRETLYQWSRNCEHIRDLTWYAEECIRIDTLTHARMWAKLAHEIAARTGEEMENVEAPLTDVEAEAVEEPIPSES